MCKYFVTEYFGSIISACLNYDITEGSDFPTSPDPVYILGKKFIPSEDEKNLRDDIRSRLWITYRKGFEEIEDTGLTSDKGWGCMIRCGQMILAEALTRSHIGRDWRWRNGDANQMYMKILSLFQDGAASSYSIHSLSKIGVDMGKEIGQWHGPNTIAQSIKKVNQEDWIKLSVNIVIDNFFIVDEIKASNSSGNPFLIFIQVRLGISEVNPIYIKSILQCFAMPQSVGIIGGTPNHALYFIGNSGENLIYLDPHTTQQTGSLGDLSTDDQKSYDATFHSDIWNQMPIRQVDPSMAIGFLCSNEKEYDDLCNRLKQEVAVGENAFMTLYQTRPECLKDDGLVEIDTLDSSSDSSHSADDEFEVLK